MNGALGSPAPHPPSTPTALNPYNPQPTPLAARCFCLQLLGGQLPPCPLSGSNSFFSRCALTPPPPPGAARRTLARALNGAWKNEGASFSLFVDAVAALSTRLPCPTIQGDTLADSLSAYYCNCMCTVLSLSRADCVNRERHFFFFFFLAVVFLSR